MKDRRIAFVRSVLSELVESLEATVRIGRWQGQDDLPDPLRESAALLSDRLGRANRVAKDKFNGSISSIAAITAMSSAIQRLDIAFVAYRSSRDERATSAALDAEIARVRSEIPQLSP